MVFEEEGVDDHRRPRLDPQPAAVAGVNLAIEIIAGAVLYFAGAFVIARPITLDLIALLKEAVAKRRGRGRPSTAPESDRTPT